MRENLLKWLVCPVCGHELKLDIFCCKGNEIIEGKLHCPCDQKFPIIGGVPRLIRDALQEELPQLYPDFFNRNPKLFDDKGKTKENDLSKEKKATMSRFGYEWLSFTDYDCDNFKPFIAPLPEKQELTKSVPVNGNSIFFAKIS